MRSCSYCATLPTVAERDLGELSGETKGVLLAFVSLGADESVFGALDGEDRERCSQVWRTLARLDEGERERHLARWRLEATSGLPSGVERLHPSWIEGALVGKPSDVLEYFRKVLPQVFRSTVESLVGRGGMAAAEAGIPSELAVEIERVAFGHLAPLCDAPCGPLGARLCALDWDALQEEVTRLGARTVGHSLAGTPASVCARAMALAGKPWADVMAEAFAENISDEERRAAMVHAATQVHDSARSPSERLLQVGLAALKVQLAKDHPGSAFRVAGRLPAQLGRQLLEG
jgi:hypothetical protein